MLTGSDSRDLSEFVRREILQIIGKLSEAAADVAERRRTSVGTGDVSNITEMAASEFCMLVQLAVELLLMEEKCKPATERVLKAVLPRNKNDNINVTLLFCALIRFVC